MTKTSGEAPSVSRSNKTVSALLAGLLREAITKRRSDINCVLSIDQVLTLFIKGRTTPLVQ